MNKSQGKPYVIGITGSIACGKSTIGKMLEDLGVAVIDTDALAHELLDGPNPAYQAVLTRFGADLCDAPGRPINRAKLGAIVFSDAKARADLEAILHPAIENRRQERIAALADAEIIAVQVPLLFEAKSESRYDEVWAILVDRKTQVQRLMSRPPGMSDEQANKRIAAQWSQEKKAALAHRIIDNSGTLTETRAQLEKRLAEARAQARAKNAPAVDAQPVVPASRNNEYREILARFGALGTEQALEKMGDVSTTAHKEASASVTLTVDKCEGEHGSPGHQDSARELHVDVHMSVRNKPGAPPQGDGCPCGCKNCRAGCACAPDCGCHCTPPKPPTPPQPPKPPAPPQPPCKPRRHYGLLAFLAFLAFLVAALLIVRAAHHDHGNNGGGTTVIVEPPCNTCTTPPNGPIDTTPPPVAPPADSSPNCGGNVQTLTDPPAFTQQYTHNWVRFKATTWTVKYFGDCAGAQVIGRDNAGRLVNWQEYGSGFSFQYQWLVSYDASTVQVDRFEPFNTFVGRTIYTYDNRGVLIRVQQLDGHQRVMLDAAIEHDAFGMETGVVRKYDPNSGRYMGNSAFDASGLRTLFFLFDTYGQG